MTKNFIFIASLLFAISILSGCNSLGSSEKDEAGSSSSVSNSLENYNTEMVTEALKEHPNFPKLNPNEPKTEEVAKGENNVTVTYSINTESISHGSTTTNTDSGEKWEEATTADYFVTLNKVWKTKDGNIESYWKYRYNPQTDEVKLVESKDNDN